MRLPLPTRITWKQWSQQYKIDTPTFRLTPVEKPDMSPFLIHMTGKDAIFDILKGNNAPRKLPKGHGYLQASVPEYNSAGTFDAQVVCFSESPTFALDFFRYRKIDRWRDDQRFGIGFDKASLVAAGVRPVIYAEESTLKSLIYLHHEIVRNNGILSAIPDVNERLVATIEAAYPLLYPLLENHPSQGFMWEREWRHPNPDGFAFRHKDIRVICCPEDEEHRIRKLLGDIATRVDFVRTWQEYDDVTGYLRHQTAQWRAQTRRADAAGPRSAEQKLQDLIQRYTTVRNSLDSYHSVIRHFERERDALLEERGKLDKKIGRVQERLSEEMKKQRAAKARAAARKSKSTRRPTTA